MINRQRLRPATTLLQGAQGPLVLSPPHDTMPRLFDEISPSPLLRQRLGYRGSQRTEPRREAGARGRGRWEVRVRSKGQREKEKSTKSVLGIVMLTIGSYRAKSLKG